MRYEVDVRINMNPPSHMTQGVKVLWDMYDIWANAGIESAYTRRRAIIMKTRALIEMDRQQKA